MSNGRKYTFVQQLVIIGLLAILVWDVLFNKSIFNVYHLGLSILLSLVVFEKFKLDSLIIKKNHDSKPNPKN